MSIEKYQRQDLNLEEQPELKTVYQAIAYCAALFTGYKNPKIQYNLNTNELEIYDCEDDLNTKTPLSLMNDDCKDIISIVADIACRMAILNPQLLNHVLEETSGIVMIDEIHLHPHRLWSWSQVINILTSIFPKVQFLLTTDAAIMLDTVNNKHLRIPRTEN